MLGGAAGRGDEGAVDGLRGEEQREAVTQPAAEGVATASQAEEPRHRGNRDRRPEWLRVVVGRSGLHIPRGGFKPDAWLGCE